MTTWISGRISGLDFVLWICSSSTFFMILLFMQKTDAWLKQNMSCYCVNSFDFALEKIALAMKRSCNFSRAKIERINTVARHVLLHAMQGFCDWNFLTSGHPCQYQFFFLSLHYDDKAQSCNPGLQYPHLHGPVHKPDNLYNRGSSMLVNSLHSGENNM